MSQEQQQNQSPVLVSTPVGSKRAADDQVPKIELDGDDAPASKKIKLDEEAPAAVAAAEPLQEVPLTPPPHDEAKVGFANDLALPDTIAAAPSTESKHEDEPAASQPQPVEEPQQLHSSQEATQPLDDDGALCTADEAAALVVEGTQQEEE